MVFPSDFNLMLAVNAENHNMFYLVNKTWKPYISSIRWEYYSKKGIMIETIIYEADYEAFLLWHQAISNGLIDKKSIILIHVDSHDDFLCPTTDRM